MGRASHQLLRTLSVCPICFEQTGALTDGARMGAAVLAVVLVGVLAAIGRFGWRILRHETSALDRAATARQEAARGSR